MGRVTPSRTAGTSSLCKARDKTERDEERGGKGLEQS
jgi:hypothetical protein